MGGHASVQYIRDTIRDTFRLNPAKRKRVAHSPLRVPGSGSLQTRSSSEQQTERASSFLRFRAFRPTAAPWLLLSVYVWWGGNPSPVINSYNPDSSSHPTHITERHAVGRLLS